MSRDMPGRYASGTLVFNWPELESPETVGQEGQIRPIGSKCEIPRPSALFQFEFNEHAFLSAFIDERVCHRRLNPMEVAGLDGMRHGSAFG
jgi:hypothetical protein